LDFLSLKLGQSRSDFEANVFVLETMIPYDQKRKKVRNLGEVEEAKLSVIIYYLILLPVILYI
jgi:hypothetical protein